ncbi:MAG: hypothetical protein ORN29_09840 [Rhodoferax sp.]|nr:hypothetical protein [Rhodoferax sp.]
MGFKDKHYRRAARDILVLDAGASESGRTVAVNLVWRTVMQAGDKQPAIMARDAGASHYCSVQGTVGYGKLPSTRNGLRPTATAAAITPLALLAMRHISNTVGNTAALLALTLGQGTYWLCSIRNGLPSGPEEVVASLDILRGILEEASDLAIDNEAESFTLFTDAIAGSASDMDIEGLDQGLDARQFSFPVQALTLNELLREQAAPGDVLQAVGISRGTSNNTGRGQGKASSPVRKAVMAGLPLLLAYGGYSYYQQEQEEQASIAKAAAERAATEKVIDPAVLWSQAIQSATRHHHAADALVLKTLRSSLGKVPVDWLGWQLKSTSCSVSTTNPTAATAATERGRSWDCVASYEAKEQSASFAQLQAAVPAGFSARFLPTTKASLHWAVQQSVAPLEVKTLPFQSQTILDLGSTLQGLRAELTELPSFTFVPLADLVPPKDKSGTAVAQPVSMETPVQASLNLKGPLRSLDSIIQQGIAANWSSLTVQLSDSKLLALDPANAVASINNNSTANTSALTFELSGVVYAKN